MLIADSIMILLGPITAAGDVIDVSVVLRMLALGVLSTGLAYIWSFEVIWRVRAMAASSTMYAMPLVGVALGVLVLHGTVTWNQVAGGTLVILSLLLGRTLAPRASA
jgi:drug/metabolite transporter (DMT)-like permease